MSTPTLDQFLQEISRILRSRNAQQVQEYLLVEPPYPHQVYYSMIDEIRQTCPKGNEDALEAKCSNALPEARDGEEGSTWTAFVKFIVVYFVFLRDVNVENLLDTYNLLSELVQKGISALGHASLGILVLPAVVRYSQMLSKLAIGLDKQPQLIAHLTKQSSDEGGANETLPERAANLIRGAFVVCLNDRTSEGNLGRKAGVYKIANICLKILFACKKTRNAESLFVSIYLQSPPLSQYPRAERVTYLYYLGRFLFSNNHFYRALLSLQAAYLEVPIHCQKQRRLILIYLITSNIILGRFPSRSLYARPEASGLAELFQPICCCIKNGDIATFRSLLDIESPNADFLLGRRILLQLRNRCEVLVWRSLYRKAFQINGNQGDVDARKAPTLALEDLLVLTRLLERKALSMSRMQHFNGRINEKWTGSTHTSWMFDEDQKSTLKREPDPDLEGADEEEPEQMLPDMLEIESIMSSLINQGLLNGFISHKQLRFAIQGAKKKGALSAGFPNVWQTLTSGLDIEVPGWKKEQETSGASTIRLSNVRSVGVGA